MAKILVTGVNGFVGHHLVRELKSQGFSVVGAGREPEVSVEIKELLEQYFVCELTEKADVQKLPLGEIAGIINLAGLAAVGPSFDNPDLYMRINTAVLSVICEEILARGLESNIRIVAVSSGAVYDSNQQMPLTEISKVNPSSSPYTASKLAMEDVAKDYRSKGLDCIVARPLNHIGPGQGEGFLLPDLYAKISSSIASGQPLRVGKLTTKRDYTDVRDVTKAYVALMMADNLVSTTYNICSGVARSGEEVLGALKSALEQPNVETIVDESLFRPSDAPELYGSNERINKETGWKPMIPFGKTVQDFVAWKKLS
ncbi:MAG: GDP-mannose 4,6-dehydratase [Patescibacteria group bacterium]